MGDRRPEQLSRPLRDLVRRGVEVRRADVRGIDVERRAIATEDGELGYDELVVALGAELAPELVPGYAEAAHNFFEVDGAERFSEALGAFGGGRVVVAVTALPYKCPAAPYEAVLAEDGSATSAAGARLLSALPALSRLEVRVVSVVDAPFPSTIAGSDAGPATYSAIQAYYDSLPALRDATSRIAHERADALAVAGITATADVREGDAAVPLIKAAVADHSDCIVIGSRGRTGVARMFLGSVARAVLFNAPCSVLIVHGLPVGGVDGEKVLAISN